MKLTKNKLKRFIKEVMQDELDDSSFEPSPDATAQTPQKTPSEIVGIITFRSATAGVEFGTEYAEDPTYAPEPTGHGLGDGEYNIRGQYLVYRLDGKLRYLNLDTSGIKERHYDLLHNGLETEGWEENENAAIPTPEDYRGVK